MSKTAVITLIVIILIVVLAGIWWYMSSTNVPSATTNKQSVAQTQTQPTQSPAVQNNPDLSTQDSDNSDSALNTDLNSVDSQLKNLQADLTDANQTPQ